MTQERHGLSFTFSLLHPKHWLTWIGLGVVAIVSLLPTSIRHAMGRKIGSYIYNNNEKRRHNVDTDLTIAFPKLPSKEREVMALKHLQCYGCALADYSLIFFSSKNRLSTMSGIRGKEYIDEIRRDKKTVIFLLAHSVMLEFGPPVIGTYYDFFGSYKASKNPAIDWIIARSRCRYASLLVSREEGLRKLVKSMSPESVMIFLPDEDLGKDNAKFAPFFGKKINVNNYCPPSKNGKSYSTTSFCIL